MLFYNDAGTIWSISMASGEAHKLGAGDSVAFDPRDERLIVQLNENNGVRLVRMSVLGGPTEAA